MMWVESVVIGAYHTPNITSFDAECRLINLSNNRKVDNQQGGNNCRMLGEALYSHEESDDKNADITPY